MFVDHLSYANARLDIALFWKALYIRINPFMYYIVFRLHRGDNNNNYYYYYSDDDDKDEFVIITDDTDVDVFGQFQFHSNRHGPTFVNSNVQ